MRARAAQARWRRRAGARPALLWLLAAAAAACFAAAAAAGGDQDAGTTATSVMRLGLGARPAALGQAYAAVAGDATALFVNPAGIGLLVRPELDLHHQQRFAATHVSSMSFAVPVPHAVLGIGAAFFDQGRTDAITDFSPTGDRIHSSDLDLMLGGALPLGRFLLVGGRLDIRRSVLASAFDATGVAGAAGVQVLGLAGRLDLGAAVENLGAEQSLAGTAHADPLPRTVRAGAALHLLPRPGGGRRRVTAAPAAATAPAPPPSSLALLALADVWQARGSRVQFGAGGELAVRNLAGSGVGLAGRAGYRGGGAPADELRHWTFGLGLDAGFMGLDYAYEDFGVLGAVHRFTIDLWRRATPLSVAAPPARAAAYEPPPDSDGDGVPDPYDNCPTTPPGVLVDHCGCPLDGDGDGVPDHLDQCPNTPAFTPVDASGCPFPQPTIPLLRLPAVHFDLESDAIEEADLARLVKVAEALRRYPTLRLRVAGHADASGPYWFNRELSRRRAQVVAEHLLERFSDIRAERLEVMGYGESSPVASNLNREGRRRNRRVSFVPLNGASLEEPPAGEKSPGDAPAGANPLPPGGDPPPGDRPPPEKPLEGGGQGG